MSIGDDVLQEENIVKITTTIDEINAASDPALISSIVVVIFTV